MIIRVKSIENRCNQFLYDFDSFFFGITLFGAVFKAYYHQGFFEITTLINSKSIKTLVISTRDRYIDMYGDEI